jgi:selenocysteine lyase/cysteine desulfurase
VGTINDIATITRWAHEADALIFVDAVQYAPHGPIDVQELDVDFLACSAYKFFGPHLGILYGKYEHLESFPAYKVRPSSNTAPERWETGTLNHEALAGLSGTITYLSLLGLEQQQTGPLDRNVQRQNLVVAMEKIMEYERSLSAHLLAGLREIKGLKVYGISEQQNLAQRVPTIACTVEGHSPEALAKALGEQGIFAWNGNYYALGVMERLGLEEQGGALRLGMAHYNTYGEIERVLTSLEQIVSR